jgi:hypothetical protein
VGAAEAVWGPVPFTKRATIDPILNLYLKGLAGHYVP